MGSNLYRSEPVFQQNIDHCAEILQPLLNLDIRQLIYPVMDAGADRLAANTELLSHTQYTQPALFTLEYALAQLWQSWVLQLTAAIGHSIGEFVAAGLAGVFSLADGLKIVATRGRLMWDLPTGSMLSVRPLISSATADWITNDRATNLRYGADCLLKALHFAESVQKLGQHHPSCGLLEVGPRQSLTTLARQQVTDRTQQLAIASVGTTAVDNADWQCLLPAVGQLWLAEMTIDWQRFYAREHRHRVPLPSYPFELQKYWIDPLPHRHQSTPSAIDNFIAATTYLQLPMPSAQSDPPAPKPLCVRLIPSIAAIIRATASVATPAIDLPLSARSAVVVPMSTPTDRAVAPIISTRDRRESESLVQQQLLALAAVEAVLEKLPTGGPELQISLTKKVDRLVAELQDCCQLVEAQIKIEHFSSWFDLTCPPTEPFRTRMSLFNFI